MFEHFYDLNYHNGSVLTTIPQVEMFMAFLTTPPKKPRP